MAGNAEMTVAQVHPDSARGMTPLFKGLPTDVGVHIAERAYELYTSRGGEPGHELDDWLRAESDVLRT